jgi:hypothetical protein
MKNKALLTYLLIGGAAYYFIYMSKNKKKGYTITVPEPTKISEKEFNKKPIDVKTIFQKAAPIVKKLFKKKKAVGQFPDTF